MAWTDHRDFALSIVQTIAVVLAAGAGIYEFSFKDRDATRARYETTLQLIERDGSESVNADRKIILDAYVEHLTAQSTAQKRRSDESREPKVLYYQFNSILWRIAPNIEQLDRHYTVIEHCLQAGLCDAKLITTLLCSGAVGTRNRINAFDSKSLYKFGSGPNTQGLIAFASRCGENRVDTFLPYSKILEFNP